MAKFRIKNLAKIKKDILESFQKKAPSILESAIKSDLSKGVSPVEGQRFKKYSNGYKTKIAGGNVSFKAKGKLVSFETKPKGDYKSKSKSMVNLKLSGAMIESLNIKPKDKGIHIAFEDEKSSWHNNGEENLPRRALLPTKSGEKFNKRILERINTLLERIASLSFNKN